MRKITTCYLLQEDVPFGDGKIIRVCETERLAKHYKRILEPKWIKENDYGLKITKMNFYNDNEDESPTTQDSYLQTIL